MGRPRASRFHPCRIQPLAAFWVVGVGALSALSACSSPPRAASVIHTKTGTSPFKGDAAAVVAAKKARALTSTWDDFELLGVQIPSTARPGASVAVTLWWKVTDDVTEAPKVFVHGRMPAATLNSTQGDHALVGVKGAPSWNPGDILEDAFTLRIPRSYDVEELEVLAGLYSGKNRFEVESGPHEKDDRVVVGVIKIEGGRASLPTMKAEKVRAGEKMAIDGVLDEAVWARTERVGPFIRHDGKTNLKRKTWARIAWDDKNVYVGFECDDEDAHTPYTKRDDPLYNSEAVEIFIDADGDRDEYVELQAAPNDLRFDAAFKGGARKNFDTSYDVNYEVKARVNGTVNDNSDKDEGWVSEWRIPIAELRDVVTPVAVGVEWKINLFRLERIRRGEKVVRNEASAWSSPMSGDFHNLRRFGTLRFVATP